MQPRSSDPRVPLRTVPPPGWNGEDGLGQALQQVVDALQVYVSDRLELARVELDDRAATLAHQGRIAAVAAGMAVAGGAVSGLGWTGLSAAAVLGLGRVMDPVGALAVVAGANFFAGGGLVLAACRALGWPAWTRRREPPPPVSSTGRLEGP